VEDETRYTVCHIVIAHPDAAIVLNRLQVDVTGDVTEQLKSVLTLTHTGFLREHEARGTGSNKVYSYD